MGRIANKMHDTISRFYTTAKRIHEQIKKDNATFIPSIADSLREKSDEKLYAARCAAVDEIKSISADAKRGVADWGRLKGSDIGQDAQLYYSGIIPTSQEMRELMTRHEDCYTMLRLLEDWWTKTHKLTEEDAHKGVDDVAIELGRLTDTKRRTDAIDRLTASALSTIESIYRPDPTDYIKNNMMDTVIDKWGQNVEI